MIINESIWGAPETWRDVSSNYPDLKYPENGRSNLQALFNNEYMPVGTFDKSISMWGIGKGSLFSHAKYISPYIRDGVKNVDIRDVEESPNDKPFIFGWAGSSINMLNEWGQRYTSRDTIPISNFAPLFYQNDFITQLNYQRLFIRPLIKVCTSSNLPSSTNEYEIDDYITNYKTTYPRILGLCYEFSYINSSNNVVTFRSYNICTTFDVKGYDVTYDDKPFYGRDGFSMVQVGQSENTVNGLKTIGDTSTYNTPVENVNVSVATEDTAFRYKYCKENYSEYVPYYFFDDNTHWKINIEHPNDSSKYYVYPYLDATEMTDSEIYEYFMQQTAFLGLPFVPKIQDLENGARIGNTGVFLPVFDDNGITTGEYLEGTASLTLDNAEWTTDSRDRSGYDPNRPPTPEDGDTGDLGNFRNFTDTTHFNYPCTVYALTETNFRNFAEALNALYLTDEDTTQMELDFKGSNPTDYIINCYALPFEPNFLSSSEVGVQIGPQTLLNITGKVVNTATSFYIDCGTKAIPKRGNFLDFEPYTHIELYLPMCGTVTLDPALVVGKTIKVVMYYNVLTNSATAAVYRLSELGDTLIATSTGEIGISIPFSAYNMGQYQNAIKATENAIKQNGLKVATGVATTAVGIAGALLAPETGGLSLALTGAALAGGSSALSAAMKGGELHYELEHIAPSVSQCSSADGSLAHVIAKTIPWLFIKRARMLQSFNEEVYAKTIGHACCINDILGGTEESPRTGLTVCSNIDTSGIQKEVSTGVYIAPTVEEINVIKQAAASGIIL